MKLNTLTRDEIDVIINRHTEAPFTGEYDDFWQAGNYLCRQCNTPLYRSKDKFDAHCGWPSFDQEIPSRIKRIPPPAGEPDQITEIRCATCDAHLGHIFEGEKLTETDIRHCVNSLSLKFIPSSKVEEGPQSGGGV